MATTHHDPGTFNEHAVLRVPEVRHFGGETLDRVRHELAPRARPDLEA